MRWGSIQAAVQQLDRFVQRLHGVRQGQTPSLPTRYFDPRTVQDLHYAGRESANLRGSTRHLCVLCTVARPQAYVAQRRTPTVTSAGWAGGEKKSYKLESSDAATYRVSESSLSIKHNHARVRVASCSAYIP